MKPSAPCVVSTAVIEEMDNELGIGVAIRTTRSNTAVKLLTAR
jgi:hypothetical protein